MRIVFLSLLFRHPFSNEARGGGEISNRHLLESLSESHSVYIVSAMGTGLWGKEINGIRYFDLSILLGSSWIGNPARWAAKLCYVSIIPLLLCRFKPDVVLVSTREHCAAIRYRRITGTPVGGFIRAFENLEIPRGLHCRIKYFFQKLVYGNFGKKGVNSIDFVLPNSRYMEKLCETVFPRPRRYVIYPPVDMVGQSRSVIHDVAAKVIPLRKIGMVSSAPHKGFGLFVDLAASFNSIEFHVIGYRQKSSNGMEPALPNLILHDWVPEPEYLLAKMDIILVPSQWEEPFGRIAVEALQLGVNVLVSNVGGLPESVFYQKELILPASNNDAWKQKLREIQSGLSAYINQNKIAMENAEKFRLPQQVTILEKALEKEIEIKKVRFS
jgi:glycosyltransferase involved in cell wall biosynthesis